VTGMSLTIAGHPHAAKPLRARMGCPRRCSGRVWASKVDDMHAALLQGGQSLQCRWGLVGVFVLLAFGSSLLDLPIHLVHHLDEVNPDCQLLVFSLSLSSSILDDGRLPIVDQTWDELIVPVLLPYVSQSWAFAQARAPPLTVQP
jgi:hypothetical protein